MPNILKAPGKVHAARTFIKSFYDAGNDDRMYIGLGDAGAAWSPDPLVPDTPKDTYDEAQSFWENMIGVGLISSVNDTELVVPRKTWDTAESYVVFSESLDTGSGTFDIASGRDFYVANTETNPKVYRCITAGGGLVTVEPTHTDPTGSSGASNGQGAGADGYEWAYLYTIGSGSDVGASLLTQNWMPVPSSAQAYSNGLVTAVGDLVEGDGTAGFPLGQIFQVHATTGNTNNASMSLDTNNTWVEWTADHELGAFFAACSKLFEDSTNTGGEIGDVAYRQVALLRNPKDAGGDRITAEYHGSGSGFEAFATLTRGVVMTLDNRVTVTRTSGQTETVRLILEF